VSQASADDGRPGHWQWSVCGASVTGSQHISRGLGCDDAFGYGVAGDFVVAVVADGAGSVTGTSAWGAYSACQSVVGAAMGAEFIGKFHSAAPRDGYAIMRWLFEGALEWVVERSEDMGVPVTSLATTLCVALARPGLAVFAQIGDGIIAAENGGEITTVLIEDKSDYANATWFLQSKDAFDVSFRIAVRRDLTAFALSTDGMSYKITNITTGEAYEPFFKGAWQNVRSGARAGEFAALLRGIQDDQTGDDKTMILAVLDRQDDEFHPSARPIEMLTVSSPAPRPMPGKPPKGPVPDKAPRPLPNMSSHPLLDKPSNGLVPQEDSYPVVSNGDLVDPGAPAPPPTDGPQSARRRETRPTDAEPRRPAKGRSGRTSTAVDRRVAADEPPTEPRRRLLGRRSGS